MHLKSFIAGTIVCAVLVTSVPALAAGATKISALLHTLTVTIDGKTLSKDNLVVNGNVYVNAKEVATVFGRSFNWNKTNNTIVMNKKETESVTMTRWYGKKVVFLGDSITNGVGASTPEKKYREIVAQKLGFKAAVNYGISGTLITHDDERKNAFVDRYSKMDDDADLVVVYGGINDYFKGRGLMGKPTSKDPSEFYGALNVLMSGLQSKYPNQEIVFITPFQSMRDGVSSDKANKYSGKSLVAYRDAILNRADYYGIPVLDLYGTSGIDAAHNAKNRAAMTVDGFHPSDAGHLRIANRLIGMLKKL
jgi:lysophospholipase L1-like esterase